MPRAMDDVWEHFELINNNNGRRHVSCNYCKLEYKIGNATRLKRHVAKCKQSPNEVKTQFEAFNESSPAFEYEFVRDREPLDKSSSESSNNSNDIIRPSTKKNTRREKSTGSHNSLLSRSVFVAGLPGSSSESKYWIDAVEEANVESTFKHSDSHVVDTEHTQVEASIADVVKHSLALGLIASAWTDRNGKGIVNFSIATPKPILYKSINLGCEIETGEYLGKNMLEIIEELDSSKFVAVVTDNDENMRLAWSLVEEKYPHITCVGCVSHSLTMLCGDLLKIAVFKSTVEKVLEVIKQIKRQDTLLSYFKKVQMEAYGSNKCTLKLPSKTNWSDAILALDSFTSNKDALVAIAKNDNNEMEEHIKDNVLNQELWINIDETVNILQPISNALKLSESKNVALSDVPALLTKVFSAIENQLESNAFFSYGDIANIREALQKCKNLCIKPIHLAANLLDPRYRGKYIGNETPIATDFIADYASYVYENDQKIVSKVLTEIACFKTKTGYFGRSEAIWRPVDSLAPSIWWRTFAPVEAISPVAIRLLSIPPSSAESNRNLPRTTSLAMVE